MPDHITISVTKSFSFAAHHRLPLHNGKCQRDHGHNYRLDVTVTGPLQTDGSSTGMVMDFGDLKVEVQTYLDLIDHYSLNDDVRATQLVPPMNLPNPTAECLAVWFLEHLPFATRVAVWETDTSYATAERAPTRKRAPRGHA